MSTMVHPAEVMRPTVYCKFLKLVCLLKIIPVSRKDDKFQLISLPTLLSTLWCLAPLSYYIYAHLFFIQETDERANHGQSAEPGHNKSEVFLKANLSYKLFFVYIIMTFLLVLFLPFVMGHFYELNAAAMLNGRFVWPHKGWMLVLSGILFPATEIVFLCSLIMDFISIGLSTEGLVHLYLHRQIINLVAANCHYAHQFKTNRFHPNCGPECEHN